ncbi:MAG: hypothetical protein JNN30_19105 [Rhodanobacteraceae bacterium]|nr:hypothetical protein [Rhodanobacteraceae bacterium]
MTARREAVNSAQIEGTQANLPELLTHEAARGVGTMPRDVTATERHVMMVVLARLR